eukprot:86006_1
MLYISYSIYCVLLTNVFSVTRPNIVLLFPDQWRFDFTNGFANLSIDTPTLDSIVQNGTYFLHTVVASPLCAPSRSCIAAGKEYDNAGVPSNGYDFPMNQSTIYNLMSDNGYWVMVSGKDDLTKSHGCGLDGTYRQKELGFDQQRRCKGKMDNVASYPNATDPFAVYLQQHYIIHDGQNQSDWDITHQCSHDCCHNHACPVPISVQDYAYEDNYITDHTLAMLEDAPTHMPWFVQINWAGPHPPFIITKAMNKSVNDRHYPYPMNASENPNDMSITRRDYVAEIENLDAAFGKVIQKMRDLGQYNNTLFCMSSDHGEMLGDFNAWDKSKPWVASSNVPFACMGPGVKSNNRIDKYVTNMDMAGTFLDYSNTKMNADMNTVSLRSFMNGSWTDRYNEYRSYVSSGLGSWRMVVQDVNTSVTWKFVCCQYSCPGRDFEKNRKDGLIQLLFNVAQDLYEQNDVAALHPTVVSRLRSLLPHNFCMPGNYSHSSISKFF